jgi:hypothetical protein
MYHQLAVCLKTGPKPLPKPALHIVGSKASSFRCEYPLLSLRSSSSFLRLLPRLPVTSIPPFIFPSITCHRRQFLRKIWPIQLAFRLLISCRIFLCSLTLSNTSSFFTWSVQLISILLQHHISKLSRCFWSTARSVQISASYIYRLYNVTPTLPAQWEQMELIRVQQCKWLHPGTHWRKSGKQWRKLDRNHSPPLSELISRTSWRTARYTSHYSATVCYPQFVAVYRGWC